MFDVIISKRGRSRWEWRVRDRFGKVIMQGGEKSRYAARYESARALFLLLLAVPRPSVAAARSPRG